MEHAKLANGSRQELPIGRSPSPAEQDQKVARSAGKKALQKKTEPRKPKPARPMRKPMGSKRKSEKLVCRYCGSDDLAPSFIKRRDRRCRKCFSKHYGSAARARKAKVKK
jgi:ribosomal protein L40E